jgi:hypothetical protein
MKDFSYQEASDSERDLALEELLAIEKSALITKSNQTENLLDLSIEIIHGETILIIKLNATYFEESVEGNNRADLLYMVYLNRLENVKYIIKFLLANGFEIEDDGALKADIIAKFSNSEERNLTFDFSPELLNNLDIEGIQKEIAEEKENESTVDSPPLDARRILFEKSVENEHLHNNTGYIFKRANGEPITDASEVRKFITQQKKSEDLEISKQFKEDFPVAQSGTSKGFNAPTLEIEGYAPKYFSMLGSPTWGMEDEEPVKEKPTNNAGFIGSYVDSKPAKVNTSGGLILHDTPDSDDALYTQIKQSVFKEDFLIKKGSKLVIIAKSNEDNPGWVMVRDENNVVGWVEERYITETEPADILSHYTAGYYIIKKDDQLAEVLISQVPKADLSYSGIQNFAFAFKLLNAGNSGLYFEPITEGGVYIYQYYHSKGEDVALEDADRSQLFNSVKLYEGGRVRIPTKAFVEKAKADGLIKQPTSARETLVEMIKYGDYFLEGAYDGFVTAAQDFVQGIWDMIKSIFTGDIFDQLSEMWDYVSNASWTEVKALFSGAVGDFQEKWLNDDLEKRWHFRGEVLGQILFELVLAIFTGGGAILGKISNATKLGKMLGKLNSKVGKLKKSVPSSVRKKLDDFSAKQDGPIELKSKKGSDFVPIKDTDKTLKEAFDKKRGDFEEQFEKDLLDETSDLIKDRAAALKRYKAKGGSMPDGDWELKYNTLAKNRKIGKIGEKTFKEFMDGYKPDFGIDAGQGTRFIDNIKPNTKTAREIKTGRVKLTKSIKKQIDNDFDIIKRKLSTKVKKVEWHFLDGADDKVKKYIADKIKEI